MKTPLSTEMDLGPGHIVLDGDLAPQRKGHSSPPPLYGPCVLWPRSPISATAELLLKHGDAIAQHLSDRVLFLSFFIAAGSAEALDLVR